MKPTLGRRRFLDALLVLSVHVAIFAIGLQYAFYQTFSQFRPWDDEGSMMLRVWEFISDPRSPDALSGVYGPFYYLHKYAIYGLLNADVSHDINRFTTIAFWALIAAACAFFVYRISHSLVFSAIVHMQVILHLRAFVNEPGHPHEIALFLIVAALVLSTFVSDRRIGLPSMIALGFASGALLLVKVNLGVFQIAALALAALPLLPRSTIVLILRWLSGAIAVSLPAAIMWRHLHLPWAWNYCALATSAIASCFIVSMSSRQADDLRWSHVGAAATGAALAVAGVGAVMILGWGQSFRAVVDNVFLRALSFPSLFIIPAPIDEPVAVASGVSLAIALFYALVAAKIAGRGSANLVLALVKLAYGCFAFYELHTLGPNLLRATVPIPFVWLALAPSGVDRTAQGRFSRVFLCLLAAFQTLQAYPVHGSQATWSVFLIAPVAAICVADALRTLRKLAEQSSRREPGRLLPRWMSVGGSMLLLVVACVAYYREANLVDNASAYWKRTPLDLPGSKRLRLAEIDVRRIRWQVISLNANCDGFVGMPGFSSLYFWTRIPPPGSISSTWILFMDDDQQRAIIEKMERYERPCVMYNLGLVNFWTGDKPVDPQKPLVNYIQTRFKQIDSYAGIELLARDQASRIGRSAGS